MQAFQIRKIIVKSDEGYVFIPLSSIEFLQDTENSTRFYLNNGKAIDTEMTFDYFKSFMQPFGFYLVHNEHLINAEHIKSYDSISGYFATRRGNIVPTSDEEIQVLLADFQKGKVSLV